MVGRRSGYGPLPDVAGHIEESVGAGALGIGADRRGAGWAGVQDIALRPDRFWKPVRSARVEPVTTGASHIPARSRQLLQRPADLLQFPVRDAPQFRRCLVDLCLDLGQASLVARRRQLVGLL